MTSFSLPKARRLGLMLALCLAIEALAPAPASAWFGWLDRWSGPGKFWGLMYEMRLLCFGPDSGIDKLVDVYAQAQLASQPVLSQNQVAPASVSLSMVTAWQEALDQLLAAQIRWQSPDLEKTRAALSTIRNLGKDVSVAQFTALVTAADEAFSTAVQSRAGQMATIAGTGMFWSACPNEKERRVSIELNVNDWHSFDNENNASFSGGTSIRFITVMPSVTWRMFANQKADVLDVGIAAGYYAFTSEGFATVDGFIVEPLRVDLHAPSSWAAYPRSNPKRLASMVSLRAGVMTIPAGFAANAFARGSHRGPIKAEIVPTIGLFFNLNSLFSNKTLKPTITAPITSAPGASRRSGAAAPW